MLPLVVDYLPRLPLLVSILIVANCDGPEPAPEGGEDGGIGTDETVISNVEITSAPASYNYASEDSFVVTMKATVTPQDWNRKSRLWFEITNLSGTRTFSRSNWLEVASNDETEKDIEWGGAWLYGSESSDNYDVSSNIITYDTEVVKNEASGNKVSMTIHKFDGAYTGKTVEYDEQLGQDVYDVAALDDITDGQLAVDQAFYPAGVWLQFSKDETSITPVVLLNGNDDEDSQVRLFVDNHRNQNKDAYVAGIRGFYTGTDPDSIDNAKLGITVFHEGIRKGCLIAHEAIITSVNAYLDLPYDHPETRFRGHKNLHQFVIIHELGHFLGNIHHPKNHTSLFCVMYTKPVTTEYFMDELEGGPNRSTYVNPHFCGDCLDKIRNNS